MLFDPKWQTKVDPLTMESLIEWLEKQPAAKQYDFDDCSGKCLYGLYMASHGVAWFESGAYRARDSGQERSDFCVRVYYTVATAKPWTFGAALKRARAAINAEER